jgi:hypothetical protein
VSGVHAGVTLTVPLPASGAKGQDRACARRIYKRPSHTPPYVVVVSHRQLNKRRTR